MLCARRPTEPQTRGRVFQQFVILGRSCPRISWFLACANSWKRKARHKKTEWNLRTRKDVQAQLADAKGPTVQRSDAAGDRSSPTSIDAGTAIAVPSFPKLAIPVPALVRTWREAHYAEPGYLLFLQGSKLVAQPFDAKRLRLTDKPKSLSDLVGRNTGSTGSAMFSLASGVLAYQENLGQRDAHRMPTSFLAFCWRANWTRIRRMRLAETP
jgi:hypothetical protein